MRASSLFLFTLCFSTLGCGISGGPSLLGSTVDDSSNNQNPPNSNVPRTILYQNGQPANVVIGQADFVSNGHSATASTMYEPWGDPSVNLGMLWINDYGNSRILAYNIIPTVSGESANFAVGQADLTSHAPGYSQSRMYYPWSTAISNGVLAVADFSDNRVLLFTPLPTTFLPNASTVVGQTNFTAYATGCNAQSLHGPSGVSLANGKLVIADYSNHRVLIYNQVPTTYSVPADLVLGQPTMNTCTANQGSAPSASTLNGPGDAWTDGNILLVADSGNHRILIWKTFPTTDGQPADVVLGQSTFSGHLPNQGGVTSSSGVDSGSVLWSNLSSNGHQIFYSDYNNNRALVWNSIPSTSGAAADVVIGQTDFVSKLSPNPPTQTSLSRPGGITFSGNQFFVTDYGNNRVMVFTGQ